MSQENFPAFRAMLWKAIGNRTQAQFANEANLSAEHLNRMLNGKITGRPARSTLTRIAATAKNGVAYQDLADALDRDTGIVVSEKRLAEAKEEFAPGFREAAEGAVRTAWELIRRKRNENQFPCIAQTIEEAISGLLDEVKAAYPDAPQISFELDPPRRYIGTLHEGVPEQSTVYLSMADYNTSASTEMIVYHSEAAGKTVVHDMGLTVADIFDLYGMPFKPKDEAVPDEIEDEDDIVLGPDTGTRGEPEWDAAYFVRFEKNIHFKEPRGAGVAEQRLLDALFGEVTFPAWIEGTGFYLDEIPANFAAFVAAHRKTLIENCAAPGNKEEELDYITCQEGLDKLIADDASSEEVAAWFDQVEYVDKLSLAPGWKSAVSAVMSEESGFRFIAYEKTSDTTFGEPTPHDAVLISRDYVNQNNISREALLNLVCRYASELGLTEFRDMLYKTVETRAPWDHRFVIHEKKPEREAAQRNAASEDAEFVVFEVNGEKRYPEKSGAYLVRLTDGRQMQILFLLTKKGPLWIKRNKEWSNMIESYAKTPVTAFSKE